MKNGYLMEEDMRDVMKVVCLGDDRYPDMLLDIDDPPEELYYVGDLSLLERPCISVVGSRKASGYGLWAAETIGKTLGQAGVTVVSGMAIGIDGAAHRGALSAAGSTAAVLGCGIDICFPKSNHRLRDEIARKGLIISQFQPGTPGAKYTFPMRNRIISGLSYATVVVEAGIGSGSLITAEFAAEQGREIFAVPGNIDRVYSMGSNKLIADGARPLVVIEELLEFLKLAGGTLSHYKENGQRIKKSWNADSDLTWSEFAVLNQVEQLGETTANQLSRRLQKNISDINGTVTVLEIKGLLATAMGKIFIAK